MESKYKVGDELIIIDTVDEDIKAISDMSKLEVNGNFAKISWGLRILDVKYEKPYVTLTYRNVYGKKNKVFAECPNADKFDKEKLLEKALLRAFQMEIMDITVTKNKNYI